MVGGNFQWIDGSPYPAAVWVSKSFISPLRSGLTACNSISGSLPVVPLVPLRNRLAVSIPRHSLTPCASKVEYTDDKFRVNPLHDSAPTQVRPLTLCVYGPWRLSVALSAFCVAWILLCHHPSCRACAVPSSFVSWPVIDTHQSLLLLLQINSDTPEGVTAIMRSGKFVSRSMSFALDSPCSDCW